MKTKILNCIVGGLALIATIGGAAYIAAAGIQNNVLYGLSGTVSVGNTKFYYEGRGSYKPWVPFPGQDRDGYVEIRLGGGNDDVFLRIDDLTALPLDGKSIRDIVEEEIQKATAVR